MITLLRLVGWCVRFVTSELWKCSEHPGGIVCVYLVVWTMYLTKVGSTMCYVRGVSKLPLPYLKNKHERWM